MIHTKEPWEIQRGSSNTYIVAKDEHGDTTAIALVFPRGVAGCETEGNASLMVAAPNQHKALLDIKQYVCGHPFITADSQKYILELVNKGLAKVEEIDSLFPRMPRMNPRQWTKFNLKPNGTVPKKGEK